MSDNFGDKQNRVLDVEGRNFDNVVFQTTVPPLTSELNLINQVGNDKAQKALKSVYPSGWLKVGEVDQTTALVPADLTAQVKSEEEDARSGQALASVTYPANSFKLISRDQSNIAIVNGWPIVVQGSYSSDDNSILELPVPTGSYRYDLVFLEVWRKLISENDPIYPYGNVQATPYPDNELVWNAIGFETSRRVQIQYRIRTQISDNFANPIDYKAFPEGLGSSLVKPIGANGTGGYIDGMSFRPVGFSDPGLYISGTGSDTDKETLNTVDGFVYAIPMFVIYRRSSQNYGPSHIHGSSVTKVDFASGERSDRTDGMIQDIIYASDIIDLRHQLISSGQDLNKIVQKTFRKLVAGELNISMTEGFGSNGSRVVVPGGTMLLKQDRINGSGTGAPKFADGNESVGFKRMVYANASSNHPNNVIEVPINGGSWTAGNIAISTFVDGTYGETSEVLGFYTPGVNDLVTGVTFDGTNVTIDSSSNIVGTNRSLMMQFSYDYNAGANGFFDVPKKMLESSKNVFTPVATRDNDIPVRYDNDHNLLTFNGSGVAPDGTNINDRLHYAGGNYTENHNFGHDLVIHRTLLNSFQLAITCNDGKLNNYYILGVKSVQAEVSPGVFGNDLDFTLQRTFETSPNRVTYTIGVLSAPSNEANLRISMVTGSGPSEATSLKFFEYSKQGRGIIDVYEMIEVEAEETVPGSTGKYIVDTVDKPIIAVASRTLTFGSYVTSKPYAYDSVAGNESRIDITVDTGPLITDQINRYLPVLGDYTENLQPTKIIIKAPSDKTIKVPVLVHSYILSSEAPYSFYYHFNGYQGRLSVSAVEFGKIEAEGPAIITSEGSGEIFNYSYSEGVVEVTQDLRTVTGDNTQWLYNIKAGDFISIDDGPKYRILTVSSNTSLELAEPYIGDTETDLPYEVTRTDVAASGISNIVDRMPTHDIADFEAAAWDMEFSILTSTMLETNAKVKLQDPLDTITNDFMLGQQSKSNSRGRFDFRLTGGKNKSIKLGFQTPHLVYDEVLDWPYDDVKKVFQSYLFNKASKNPTDGDPRDLTGRMFLVVLSSESENSTSSVVISSSSIFTAVDMFELVGRPLIKSV